METTQEILSRLNNAFPGAKLELVANDTPANQLSILVPTEGAVEIARFLREDPKLRLDYASSVTGVDWLDLITKEKVKVRKVIDGVEKEVDETVEKKRTGYLEAVYHLYSIEIKHGPVILRQRTNRTEPRVASLTPIWRSCEFQEREIFDLYGIVFEGHSDLRRILMWEGFRDHPMRKDYEEPDDYQWEPTPHDEVLLKAKRHYPEAKA